MAFLTTIENNHLHICDSADNRKRKLAFMTSQGIPSTPGAV